VRRDEHVHATDGPIGPVQGLVINPSDHHVSHVLLDEGHLLGQEESRHSDRRRGRCRYGVRLSLTKDEVRDLPPVDLR